MTEENGHVAVPDSSVRQQSFYSKEPSAWSVEEVIQYIHEKYPQITGRHRRLFREHEIDGKALLLLENDTMMKYLGLKLGPALKLCAYIQKLKQGDYS